MCELERAGKDTTYYEKLYIEFFGIDEFNPEGTTINKSIIEFVKYVVVTKWADEMNNNIKWE